MELWKTNNAKLNIEFFYTIEENTTMLIQIVSYEFAGEYPFCLHKTQIIDVIKSCKDKDSIIVINDGDSNSFLNFRIDKNGKGKLIGQVGGTYNDNYLHFAFDIDQTIYELLKNAFNSFLIQ